LTPGADISGLPQLAHGAIKDLKPEEPQVPWSERYWYAITIGVIVAVVLMLWIILTALKKDMDSSQKS